MGERSAPTSKKGDLSPEQRARLNELGFIWDPHDVTWEIMFVELKHYKERFGDCNVPRGWAENPQLGTGR